jgi:23S rRNA (uracil1939-C5)-methyltransferase
MKSLWTRQAPFFPASVAMLIDCQYAGTCLGCPWITREITAQKQEKLASVRGISSPEKIKWIDCGTSFLRDRIDLTWENGKLGLYQFGDQRTVLDLEKCVMASEPLQELLSEYRKKIPPITRGSVRLRVAPNGQRGVWLDFANVDVKNLFDEREYLKWLSELAIVEIGQRRKRLHWIDGAPKLKDAELFPWFQTFPKDGDQTIPLYGAIAGFTQSGLKGNKKLVTEVLRQVEETGLKEWTEFFAGSGNFSLALGASGYSVKAFELDPLAVEGFERSKQESNSSVEMVRKDLYRKEALSDLENLQGLLIDPPRAGLGRSIEVIEKAKPLALVYVSCWTESFLTDAEKLKALGYELKELAVVDQFVHSPSSEWVGTFIKASNSSLDA